MPEYKPDQWNASGVKDKNNCYSYAVDDQHKGSDSTGANPGATKDLIGGKQATMTVPLPQGGSATLMTILYTCPGMLNAALADGLRQPDTDGKCRSGCWRVAYYVKAKNEVPHGYHWVREDSPGHWSHKPGMNDVTDRQWNPDKKDYSGPKITDPSKDSVGIDYKFCGYLCCCPGTKVVAMVPASGIQISDGFCSVIAGPSLAPSLVCLDLAADAKPTRRSATAGEQKYTVDYVAQGGRATSLLVTTGAVRVLAPTGRLAEDPGGSAAAQLDALWVALRQTGPLGPTRSR